MHQELKYIVSHLLHIWPDLLEPLLVRPESHLKHQTNYWQDLQLLLNTMNSNQFVTVPAHPKLSIEEKIISPTDWQSNYWFYFLRQNYLLIIKHIENWLTELKLENKIPQDVLQKFNFYMRQYLQVLTPNNFFFSNPISINKYLQSNGYSLLVSWQRLLLDLHAGNLFLSNNHPVVTNHFKVGENIACTAGKVIYKNELIELIHYTPVKTENYQVPLLIIPPWINKYYILDLQPENSLVKWLIENKFNVFMISWINPNQTLKHIEFSDYLLKGPLAASQVIRNLLNISQINTLGYCIGGTLLGCFLAYLVKTQKNWINSATFMTTLLDFSEPGDLGIFIDEKQISGLEILMQKDGYLDGRIMSATFNILRANDFIWRDFTKRYLQLENIKPFDLSFWNADPTNIPHKVHSFYLRKFYLNNSLVQPNKLSLAGEYLDITQINVPSYFVAAKQDHIAPWESCYQSSQYLQGNKRFILSNSGHVAGIINPPHAKKYAYWAQDIHPAMQASDILKSTLLSGSWWEDWTEWLSHCSQNLVGVTKNQFIDNQKYQSYLPAPGGYVAINVTDK